MKATDQKTTTSQSVQKKEQGPFFQKESGDTSFFNGAGLSSLAAGGGSSFFSGTGIQTKLTINEPGDQYEQEADRVADQVVYGDKSAASAPADTSPNDAGTGVQARFNADTLVQREEAPMGEEPQADIQQKPIFESGADADDGGLQAKSLFSTISPLVQRTEEEVQEKPIQLAAEEEVQEKPIQRAADEEIQEKPIQRSGDEEIQEMPLQRSESGSAASSSSSAGSETSASFDSKLSASKGGGSAMDSDTKASMESSIGADFSGVRIHTGKDASEMSDQIGAQAFTHGNDIYFNDGKYDTQSDSGKHLLAHELTHTVQQGAAVQKKPISKAGGSRVQRFGGGLKSMVNSAARMVPGYTLFTVIIGYNPILMEKVPRNGENILDGLIGLIPGGALLAAKLKESNALAEAGAWLSSEVSKLGFSLGYFKSLISQAWDQMSIFKGISGNLKILKNIFAAPYRKVKTFALNIVDAIKEFIFRGALKLVGAPVETIMGIINKGKAALMKIITDPIGFFKNLAGAVGKGIKNFVKNIKKHLIGGLVTWLTGAMADVPIQMPQKFDLKGVLHLVLQILGLTYPRIRKQIVKVVGEKPVALAEKGFAIVKRVVTEGPIALWEMLKEKVGEIKQQVMEGIKSWVVTKVVKSATIQLLSMLNPAGALVQAAMKIYQLIMFLKDNLSRIMEFVMSIFNSIAEIANGAVMKAANFIENAMAKTIPMILSFLARMLNLSGIGKAIKKVIEKIRKPIDKVIGKIVNFLATKIRKLFGKGKDAKGKDDKQKYTQKDKDAGLKAIRQNQKKLSDKGRITEKNARKVAGNVKSKHPVFKSIKVVDGGKDWDYEYVFRTSSEDGLPKADEGESEKLKQALNELLRLEKKTITALENSSKKKPTRSEITRLEAKFVEAASEENDGRKLSKNEMSRWLLEKGVAERINDLNRGKAAIHDAEAVGGGAEHTKGNNPQKHHKGLKQKSEREERARESRLKGIREKMESQNGDDE
ncbi:MAG: DUF4157 domain-containing protein [Bacteroidota bacterium]